MKIDHLINGKTVAGRDYFETVNPATQGVLAEVASGTEAEVNARRNAENFDDLALPETVKFCHERGTKVFVTVNTLVTDGEMDALIEEADAIAETGATGAKDMGKVMQALQPLVKGKADGKLVSQIVQAKLETA